jgi:hypothetical protein
MANTSVPRPISPSAPSINDDDSGYNSAMESAAMATSSSPTRGVIKMDDGEIPELADFFKKTIVTEADRKAYHDLDWLSGNLIFFIPEVYVPTIEGSTILSFECQLAAGLGLPPSKFLSSVMSYLSQCKCCLRTQQLCNAMRVLIRNSSRYQLVLVLLFSCPIHQDHLWWDWPFSAT